jgi:hypothetical protein
MAVIVLLPTLGGYIRCPEQPEKRGNRHDFVPGRRRES